MPRPSAEASVRARVAAELLSAEQAEPGRYPLRLNAAAKRTGISRITLRKYGPDTLIPANQALLANIALAEGNAQRLGIGSR